MTFIDTPGHEAFGAMRSRGAQIADIAVLVVSAEEGVKPQTKEAIEILQKTETPFVVAFTKVDRTGGDVDKARNDLMTAGVLLEGFGGQISFVGVSGKTGDGVDELLDLLLLTADVQDLTYDPAPPATGYVLEARRDPRRGIEATVIIKDGTLHRGNPIATLSASGKVKMLENFAGKNVEELLPSAPAVIIGWDELPNVGEAFSANAQSPVPTAIPHQNLSQMKGGMRNSKNGPDLPLILKASDAGSLEALEVVLRGIENSTKKGLRVVAAGVGDVSDGDVKDAVAMGALIIGFKNRVEPAAVMLADAQHVTIATSKIVYDLEKTVEAALEELTSPVAGELEVLAVFNQEKPEKQLVGGRVIQGIIKSKTHIEILRPVGGEIPTAPVASGRIVTMHEKKSEIFQAEKGKEIGVVVSVSTLIMVGDRIIIKK